MQGGGFMLFTLLCCLAYQVHGLDCEDIEVALASPQISSLNSITIKNLLDVNGLSPNSVPGDVGLSPSSEASPSWKSLLLQAIQQDLYRTSNLALEHLRHLQKKESFKVDHLTCLSDEKIEDSRLGSVRLRFVVTQNEPSSASCSQGLMLPKEEFYAPPSVESYLSAVDPAMVTRSNADIVDYAKQLISQRISVDHHQTNQWNVVQMEEEHKYLKPSWTGPYLVSVIQMGKHHGYKLLLVFYDPAKDGSKLLETNYHLSILDSENLHQVVVSVNSQAKKRSSTNPFSLMKFASSSVRKEHSPRMKRGMTIERNNQTKLLRVMTYNIWNYNSNWPSRKQILAQVINETRPDIVGVQEIRYRYSGGPNQLQELAEVLQEMGTNYQYVYQPAMYYETEAEGVGVLSRYPILESRYINLTFVEGTPDLNRRIVLRTLIRTPSGPFNLFVSHFTYAQGPGQMSNAYELLMFMRGQPPNISQAAVADFNIYTGDEGPTNFLTGKLIYNHTRGDLKDVWSLARPNDTGYTFSNLPWSAGLVNRADRILVRDMVNLSVRNASTKGEYQHTNYVPASDHLAVVADIRFNSPRARKH